MKYYLTVKSNCIDIWKEDTNPEYCTHVQRFRGRQSPEGTVTRISKTSYWMSTSEVNEADNVEELVNLAAIYSLMSIKQVNNMNRMKEREYGSINNNNEREFV
jgi:hypothetical protein